MSNHRRETAPELETTERLVTEALLAQADRVEPDPAAYVSLATRVADAGDRSQRRGWLPSPRLAFATTAAAAEAGYRPCLRCRPETAPRLPEWALASDLVQRGMRLIDAGYLDDASTASLAAQLGVSARHLDRLFQAELGTTASQLAQTRRVQLAKRLITESISIAEDLDDFDFAANGYLRLARLTNQPSNRTTMLCLAWESLQQQDNRSARQVERFRKKAQRMQGDFTTSKCEAL